MPTPNRPTLLAPPVAKRVPRRLIEHEHVRVDPYYWLRDDERKDPEVLAYLDAENRFCDQFLSGSSTAVQTLKDEIIGRIAPDDQSVPYRYRGSYYYRRDEAGKEYGIFCRRRGSLDADEEILLDANQRARGHDYYALSGLRTSPDGKTLAFAEDTVSRRQYTLRFRDLDSGEVLEDEIPDTSGLAVWAADSRTVFYVTQEPETLRPHRLWRHRLGSAPEDDVLVYDEADPELWLYVHGSQDEAFILITSTHTVMQEVRYIDASAPEELPQVFLPRERGHEYTVDAIGGRFYVRTNWRASDFRLMSVEPGRTADRSAWRDEVPAREGVFLAAFELFGNHVAVAERADAMSRIRVCPRRIDGSVDVEGSHVVEFDESVYVVRLGNNPEPDTTTLRLSYTSMTTPPSVYDVDMVSRERELRKESPVLGGFDRSRYVTERIEATAADGARIPISLVHRRDLDRSQPQPLLLYGYGSYGATMEPDFASARLSLLDRGFIYAIAHVRGGQERGRIWYDQGRLLHKKNTFTDFIAASEHLVETGYTAPDRLFALGGSAGGLLMGAVANMRPDLYCGIVAVVPFVDVVTTMLDESIPLTTFEYDEWGNPHDKTFYDYMLSYSPYDNVGAHDYPAMLVLTGLHDSQVQYFEPAKWVARLRAEKSGHAPLLFYTDMDSGHGGASGRFRRHEQTAKIYAFVLGLATGDGHPGGEIPAPRS